MAITWKDLMTAGSIVDLESRAWTARERIKPQDLGIESSEAVAATLSLGCAKLAAADAFDEINAARAAARRAVDELTMPFPMIFGARFVPEKNMAKLGERLRLHLSEYEAAADAFVAGYETQKRAQAPIIKRALEDAVRGRPNADELAADAFARFMSAYPPAAEVRERFVLRTRFYAIQGPSASAMAVAMESEAASVRDMIAVMADSLRTDVRDKVRDVLTMIAKGGKLKQKSIDSALEVLANVDNLNVLGDVALAEMTRKARAAIEAVRAGERVSDVTVDSLVDVKIALQSDLTEAVAAAESKLAGLGSRKIERTRATPPAGLAVVA